VLYQLLFRSSAKPGFVPKIDGNFTLTNSLITEDNAGVHIGASAIAPTGAITLCCGQSFGAGSRYWANGVRTPRLRSRQNAPKILR
jgi:hypothetical protein